MSFNKNTNDEKHIVPPLGCRLSASRFFIFADITGCMERHLAAMVNALFCSEWMVLGDGLLALIVMTGNWSEYNQCVMKITLSLTELSLY